ncbi:fibronectin type III domain-containing protein [Geobacter pickeringii]|uniref:fibronectin type III domain-containing protein n=1 Tax=Geobacter pickeringii TaxID=345632 RepID=UPI00068DBD1C|nr:hypothetical protein [Geobacter pickeringii]
MNNQSNSVGGTTAWGRVSATFLVFLTVLVLTGIASADVPGRRSPAGTSVPNPGAQQQELPNITFPAPYNVFEFPVTCMACHGGTIDQQAGHGGNWAGTTMASAMRDPVFRANQIIANSTVKNSGAGDGAGNLCYRCHSPNGWLSGRFDPKLGGAADGTDTIHSIILSTDDEGVMCETCHRAIGAVTMKRPDLNQTDPVWNMLSGISDWPHAGSPFPQGPGAGNPYGEATLQFHDGMSYGAKYGGNMELSFSDLLLTGTAYTGQTYGVYPWWYTGLIHPPPPGMPATNTNGDVIQYNPDGSLSFQTEAGVTPDAIWGAISPEHSTRISDFVKSSEFCGACHEVTIPVLNHGMPEQRTFTEWKYSAFGRGAVPGMTDTRCQGCHMPVAKHEYADNAQVSLNPDPLLSGWSPYAKDRNIGGGTSFHKFAGANRDLPQMMKVLYPEVDLEVVGAPTGHDPRVFPGMLSDRSTMWDRAQRNTEISLRDAVSVQVTTPPTLTGTNITGNGIWRVRVRVTNNTGHKFPSGYPDGRRMWVSLAVKDAGGSVVYQSGYYDGNSARLYNDATKRGLARARTRSINSASNAVMIYEKATCNDANGDGACDAPVQPSVLNNRIMFDNRIPPLGFTSADYRANGAKFWSYTPGTLKPFEDLTRYPNGQNWDEITYTFTAPPNATLTARAEARYESHSREFMDYLKNAMAALPAADRGPRPEGPPNPLDPNYPLTPTFLSDQIAVTTGTNFATMTDLGGAPLQDNWSGVAYAAWLLTGKGAPFVMAAADTAVTAAPAAPATVTVTSPLNPATGLTDPNAQLVQWSPVAGADGYVVWIRYGANPLTSDWSRLAVVSAPQTQLLNEALNVAKTYVYQVQAFNAFGTSASPLVDPTGAVTAKTPVDLPLPPLNTKVLGVTDHTVALTWYDEADNEIGFIVERQDVPLDRTIPLPNFREVARFTSPNAGPPPGYLNLSGFGGITFTDGTTLPVCTPLPLDPALSGHPNGCYSAAWTALLPGRTYNYRISAYNASGASVPDLPVAATLLGLPPAPTALTAVVFNSRRVDLSWTDNSGSETGFRIERATDAAFTANRTAFTVGPNITTYSDVTVLPSSTYYYRVVAFNANGSSAPSNTATVTTPKDPPPLAPGNLKAAVTPPAPTPPRVSLTWTDNATNETGFTLQRATDPTFPAGGITSFTVGPNVTAFTDTTVTPKATYYYRLFAFNGGGPSAFSNMVMAVTPGQIPEAPTLLKALLITSTSVTLGWVDNSTNEQGFYVERSLDGVTFTRIGTTAANFPRFTNTALKTMTNYWYRVQAFNADGVSAFTDTIQVVTR